MLFIYDYRHLMGKEAMVQSEARKMGFECPASAFERTFTLAVARSMPPSLLFCFAFLLSHFSFFFFKSSLCRATSHRWKADVAATRATGSGVGVAEQRVEHQSRILLRYAAMITAYMYIDDADWLHSLEEASAAPCTTTCFANCRVCPPCLTHCGALRRSTTKSKSPPARPLKNVTQRANQLLRAFAFSPCSDAEMRSERTHAGPQFLLDCLFALQPTDSRHGAASATIPPSISSRSRGEDALDEWFLDDPKKKTLKGFAPLMPQWQLARIA
eukprot:gene355-200_t